MSKAHTKDQNFSPLTLSLGKVQSLLMQIRNPIKFAPNNNLKITLILKLSKKSENKILTQPLEIHTTK